LHFMCVLFFFWSSRHYFLLFGFCIATLILNFKPSFFFDLGGAGWSAFMH
jgi:hypothetical protein